MLRLARRLPLSRLAQHIATSRRLLLSTRIPPPTPPSQPARVRNTHSRPHTPPPPPTTRPTAAPKPATSSSSSFLISPADLSYRSWLKLLAVACAGVVAGGLLAQHGARVLAQTGVYTYEPDDDDGDDGDDDDGDEKPVAASAADAVAAAADKTDSHAQELAALFGDFRINVAYNWTAPDETYITLAREKLVASLQELDALIAKEAAVQASSGSGISSPSSPLPTLSPELQQQQLQQLRPLHNEQDRKEIDLVRRFLVENLALLDARAAALAASAATAGDAAGGGRWFAKIRRWVGLT
ncbi:hypothetical protein HDU87_000441 [Geranomyces variabilis]|uniref:Uncharacterized protein n=1 Tax=Geranomyces variabilis TaxID=109894 RepID=A0AAD5TRA6_9FUNG|nr:hypothetical protein HDU87_000441 [Geranomyces variabilis]